MGRSDTDVRKRGGEEGGETGDGESLERLIRKQHFENSFNVPERVSTFCVTRCKRLLKLVLQRRCTYVSAKSFNV